MNFRRFLDISLAFAAFAIALGISELIVRMLPLTDHIAWSHAPTRSERVQHFNKKAPRKIVCLGDSVIEWRTGEKVNMIDRMQARLSSEGYAFLNLGQAGVDLDKYLINYYQNVKFNPESIILFIYLGNDVHYYTAFDEIKRIAKNASEEQKNWKEFLKKYSVLANTAYRFAKRHFKFFRSGFFARNLNILNNYDSAKINSAMKKLDTDIIELAETDTINPWIPATGATFPNYYRELFGLKSEGARQEIDSATKLINEFYKEQKKPDFLVVLLPESIQISTSYDPFFKKCGFILDDFPLADRRKITASIKQKLQEFGMAVLDVTPALENSKEEVYFPQDTHLNARGHQIVAEFLGDFIEKNQFSFPNKLSS